MGSRFASMALVWCATVFAWALAWGSPGEEAARQLNLAEEDLAAGNFERAAASAASALRLDPSLHAAFVTRALALRGLGEIADAAALLRAYVDLRGGLPLDDRVEVALAEIEAEQARATGAWATGPPAAAGEADLGPLAVLYGPTRGPEASEVAYTAARPYLGGQPAASVLPLATVLPPSGDQLVVLGGEALTCADVTLQGTLAGHIANVEESAIDLEPAVTARAVTAAEEHLACGAGAVERETVAQLLAVRAGAAWFAGEPERAARLWREQFALAPEANVDAQLPPTAQALALDAKARAGEDPTLGHVRLVLASGWTAWIDGEATEEDRVSAPAGRRVLRLVGPAGEVRGAVVEVAPGGAVVVGTGDGVHAAVHDPDPSDELLRWLGARVAEVAGRDGAAGAVLVNLGTDPVSVRRFDGRGSLVLTPGTGQFGGATVGATGISTSPRGGSIALLAGGLGATAVGLVVAVVAHSEGVALQDGVDSQPTLEAARAAFDAAEASYAAARSRERVGVSLAIGGGIVAAVGGVTIVLPQSRKVSASQRR